MSQQVAHARATFTIEVSNIGSWGHECQLAQIYKQATESAVGKIRNALAPTDVRIVGDIKITAILIDDTISR
jgi:hypothetical protein